MAVREVTLKIEMVNERLYSRAFEVTGRRARDMSEPLGTIAERLLGAIERQFETEGRWALGRKWRALSPDYKAWKAIHFPGRPILQQTGKMKVAMTSRQAIRVTQRSVHYRPVPPSGRKARWHHAGVPENNLPARPIVAITRVERRQWDRVWAQWLRDIREPPLR